MVTPCVLGLITARGGSKSVPHKNIRPLLGKPLLLYTIEEAQKSKTLTRVILSTESDAIAAVARRGGCEVLARPAELAQDDTPHLPVVQHAIQAVERQLTRAIDYVVILQPTSPLRRAEHIDACVRKLIDTGADSVVSVCRILDYHPRKMKRIEEDRLVPYSEDEVEGARRQDLPPAYWRNGAVYAMRRDLPMKQNTLFGRDCRPYVMAKEDSVDINDELDLQLAELLLAERLGLAPHRQAGGG